MSIRRSIQMRSSRLAVGLWVLPVAAGCSMPSIQNIAMEIQSIDFDGVEMAFNVDVSNPLPLSLGVPAGGYVVDIAGEDFIKSDSVPATELASGTVTSMTLPVKLRYLDLFRLANNLRGKSQVPYDLKGHLEVPVAGQQVKLPFSHAGEVPVMSLPTISVQDVKFSGGNLAIDAELSNPNTFSIGLEDLGYAVKLGDVELGNLQASTSESIAAGQTGRVSLGGGVSATQAITQLMRGVSPGSVDVRPTGKLRTPYGAVALPSRSRTESRRGRGS